MFKEEGINAPPPSYDTKLRANGIVAEYMGIWRDTPERALPIYLGIVQKPEDILETAKNYGYTYIGFQDYQQGYGHVWAGKKYAQYDKYGRVLVVGMATWGQKWENVVYKII